MKRTRTSILFLLASAVMFIALAALVALAEPGNAERIVLTSGRSIEGTVIREDGNTLTVEVHGVQISLTTTISKSEVARREKASSPTLADEVPRELESRKSSENLKTPVSLPEAPPVGAAHSGTDTSKVFVAVDAPADDQQVEVKSLIEDAMTGRPTGRPSLARMRMGSLGGLTVVTGTAAGLKNAGRYTKGASAAEVEKGALAAGAGSILHIRVKSRTVALTVDRRAYDNTLIATCTIQVADGKNGWTRVYTSDHVTKSAEFGRGSGVGFDAGSNDCYQLAVVMEPLLMAQLFPCKYAMNKGALDVTIKNTSQLTIEEVSLAVPMDPKGGVFISSSETSIAPGKEVVVSFSGDKAAQMRDGKVSGIRFERQVPPGTPGKSKTARGRRVRTGQ